MAQDFDASGRFAPEEIGNLIACDEAASRNGDKLAGDRLRQCVDFANAEGADFALRVLVGERAAAKNAGRKPQLTLAADGSLHDKGSPDGAYGYTPEERSHLDLPPWAPASRVRDALARHNAADERKNLNLPVWASDGEVRRAEAKHAGEAVRKYVDLPPWSTGDQAQNALGKQTGGEVRQYLDLPPWAPDAQVDDAERRAAGKELRAANGLPESAPDRSLQDLMKYRAMKYRGQGGPSFRAW